MRELSLDIFMAPQEGARPQIVWTPFLGNVRAADKNRRFFQEIAEGAREDQLYPVFRLLGRRFGVSDAESAAIEVRENFDIVFTLPEGSVTQPWQVAILFNIIDGAAAPLLGDEEFRTVENATLLSPVDPAPVPALYAALNARKDAASAWISEAIPTEAYAPSNEDFQADGWPADFAMTGCEIEMTFDRPLNDPKAVQELETLLLDLELILGWGGFETENYDQEEWEEDKIPYPMGREGSPSGMRYWCEQPPGNPAWILHLFAQILEVRYERQIADWSVRLYETF